MFAHHSQYEVHLQKDASHPRALQRRGGDQQVVVGRSLVQVHQHLVQEGRNLPVDHNQHDSKESRSRRPDFGGPLRQVRENLRQDRGQVELDVCRRQRHRCPAGGERFRQERTDGGVVEGRRDLDLRRPTRLLRRRGLGSLGTLLGGLECPLGLFALELSLRFSLPGFVLGRGHSLQGTQSQRRNLLCILVRCDAEQNEKNPVLELLEARGTGVVVEGRQLGLLEA
mmetsp:Transcript_86107/g.278172  ORF Transcript_86107/g.278172 Transcript_86107/m.278172 type:complete len:226 (-) Transcript_86107:889-1566(-)